MSGPVSARIEAAVTLPMPGIVGRISNAPNGTQEEVAMVTPGSCVGLAGPRR